MKTGPSYGEKRRIQGGDSYGHWKEGVQTSPERINGKTLRYEKGQWR